MTPTGRSLLRLRDWSLSRQEAGRQTPILDHIDLEIRRGRWLAVLGANGSGKSSLLNYLASDESPLAESSAIMFQDPDDQIIASTVERELTLGRARMDPGPVLEEFGLREVAGMDPRLLSAGQKQRLVLAVALGTAPEVLFCDEPTALQDDTQAAWVLDRLQLWRKRTGGALVTATCDRREVQRADRLLVLENGRADRSGPVAELLDDSVVKGLLDRGSVDRPGGQAAAQAGDPDPGGRYQGDPSAGLHLQDVACRLQGPQGGFSGVRLQAGPGRRIGITGPNGCGKSTLLAVCVGARRPDAGAVAVDGRRLYRRNERDLDHGLALLAPQFPEYLFTRTTVAQELSLDPGLAGRPVPDLLEAVGLDPGLAHRNPHSLSSGQKRRLALGLVLFSGRKLLLLDEPTAALDAAGREMVLSLLADVDPEATLVIASHDRTFLRRAGCRCLELHPDGLKSLP